MGIRRFTSLTNAFGSKIDNRIYALSLNFVFCNFVQTHGALRVSPATAASLAGRLCSMNDIVAPVEARASKTRKRGPHKTWIA